MYAKNLREQLPRLADQMNAIVNKAKTENNRGLSSEERESFHKLESDYSNLEDSIKIAEKTQNIVDELSKSDGKITELQTEQLRDEFRTNPKAKAESARDKAFKNYVRKGINDISAEDRNLLSLHPITNAQTVTTTGGGYLIPSGFADTLESAMKWFGGIEGTVKIITTETGQPIPFPSENDTTNKGRILGINTQATETDLVFGQPITLNAYNASSDAILVPEALIQDSYFDLDTYIATALGIRLGRNLNYYATVGTGSSQPTGIVVAATAAGNVTTFSTGGTTAITYANLVDIEHSVDPAYRNNSTWMFSDAVLKTLKKLVDGNNRPLWQPGLTSSFREGAGVDTIKPLVLDHSYAINQDVSVPAANAYSIVFGDLSKFIVRKVGGIRMYRLMERYRDYDQTGYLAFMRYDSNLLDAGTLPVAVARQSAT
jgi:HK97 family phage major capsid protein